MTFQPYIGKDRWFPTEVDCQGDQFNPLICDGTAYPVNIDYVDGVAIYFCTKCNRHTTLVRTEQHAKTTKTKSGEENTTSREEKR